jgi:hypothetical protein
MVRGWSADIAGTNWPAVQAYVHQAELGNGGSGVFGTSAVANLVIGGTALPAATLFSTSPGATIQGFVLGKLQPHSSNFTLSSKVVGSTIQITVPTTPGGYYSVEYLSTPFQGPWQTLESFTADGNSKIISDSILGDASRLYRAHTFPP